MKFQKLPLQTGDDDQKCTRSLLQSNDGFDPFVWGPCTWILLHSISLNYPVNPSSKNVVDYMNFFINLGKVLPCKSCRKHYRANLRKMNFGHSWFRNRETLSRKICNLHNVLNEHVHGSQKCLLVNYDDMCSTFLEFKKSTRTKPRSRMILSLRKFEKKT
jgi:hypothetical protein